MMNLAARLNEGITLPVALRDSRLVSRDVVLLVWVGQECGTLPQALRLASTVRSNQVPVWTGVANRLSYVIGLLLAIQAITFFIFYFIVPKMESIFNDFGLSLPRATIFTIEAAHFLIKYALVTVWLPPLEVALLVFLPLSFRGWGNYHVPIFDRLLGRRHTALVLRALSLVVDGHKSLAQGLSILANHYPTRWVQRRLIAARAEVADGAQWVDALWRNRVIRGSDAEVLQSAAAVGNLSWALRELADTTERRLAFRAQAIVELLFPLVILGLGMLVFIVAISYFLPLVELISQLANS
jgi:type II secretory pathway component PulF